MPTTPFREAKWVIPRDAAAPFDTNRSAFFRLDFQLPDPLPKGASLRLCVTAHTRYKLRLNGTSIAVGPRKANSFQYFYERLDVSDGLLPGDNTLYAQVVAYAPLSNPKNVGLGPISVLTYGVEPALLAAGGVYDGDKLIADVSTGRTAWVARTADEGIGWLRDPQTYFMGAMERHDAARLGEIMAEPSSWPDVDAPDRWWTSANQWGEMPEMMLQERTIPLMYETEYGFTRQMPCADSVDISGLERGHVTKIPANTRCALELDAGELTTGYMLMKLCGGDGAVVRIRYAECYRKKDSTGKLVKGIRDEPCEDGLLYAYDELSLCGGDFSFESFWFRTFRFVRIEIETAAEALSMDAPRYIRTGYPLEVTAAVSSKQAWVKDLFDVSVRTLRCCMHETYEDCPFFEQLQYISDTRLQMDFTYAISGDLRLARQVIEDYHRSLMPDGMLQSRTPAQVRQAIPQFALYWIHMLDALYEQDADAAFVARYRPTIDAVLDYFDRRRDERGLVDGLGYWDFGDWVPDWENGVPHAVAHGPSTIHNLAYAWTLQIASRLARITGRTDTAEEYSRRSADLIALVKEHCFDSALGLFREGPDFEEYSQHAQVFGVLSGALEGEAAACAMKGILARKDAWKCTYPQQFYLLRALEKAGLYDLSTDAVWKGLKDLLPLNITTLPETPEDPRSDCHAWSALPLYDVPRVWLGVRPGEPGWGSIVVKPHFLSALDDLSGCVPTPHGLVEVSWKRVAQGVELSVKSPAGVPLVLRTPDGKEEAYPQGGEIKAMITE